MSCLSPGCSVVPGVLACHPVWRLEGLCWFAAAAEVSPAAHQEMESEWPTPDGSASRGPGTPLGTGEVQARASHPCAGYRKQGLELELYHLNFSLELCRYRRLPAVYRTGLGTEVGAFRRKLELRRASASQHSGSLSSNAATGNALMGLHHYWKRHQAISRCFSR